MTTADDGSADAQPDAPPEKPTRPRPRRDLASQLKDEGASKRPNPLVLGLIALATIAIVAGGVFVYSFEDRAIPWIEFSPERGRFAAKFPGKPELLEKVVDTPSGPLRIRFYICGSEFTRRMHSVMYLDLAEAAMAGRTPEQILDSFRLVE